MRGIAINGKFLAAPLNGVHRTAAHYAAGLVQRASRVTDVEVIAPVAPKDRPEFGNLAPVVRPGRFGSGQGWEMLTLPSVAKGRLLVNFCNLAPVAHGNSVVMIHDAQVFLFPGDYSAKQRIAYRALLRTIARRARLILTVSEFAKSSLLEHGLGTEDRIAVVLNGTDHILSVPSDPHVLANHGLTSGGYALTLGSAKGYKNIARVFEAMAHPAAPDLPLVVAGGPDPSAYAERGWTAPPHTVFTGFVSDTELRALYEGAAFFAFPSKTEGFGLPPVEAMHCRTPVVAAAAGAMPEVCGPAATMVDPDDTEGWAHAFAALADEETRRRHIAAGQARAASLTWDHAGERVWSVIRPLL